MSVSKKFYVLHNVLYQRTPLGAKLNPINLKQSAMNQRKEQNRSMISEHGKVAETIRGEQILLETREHLAKECEATRDHENEG